MFDRRALDDGMVWYRQEGNVRLTKQKFNNTEGHFDLGGERASGASGLTVGLDSLLQWF